MEHSEQTCQFSGNISKSELLAEDVMHCLREYNHLIVPWLYGIKQHEILSFIRIPLGFLEE